MGEEEAVVEQLWLWASCQEVGLGQLVEQKEREVVEEEVVQLEMEAKEMK